MFYQADLFEPQRPHSQAVAAPASASSTVPDVADRISAVTRRPRYALLVLDLIARRADAEGRIGPYVATEEGRVPVRDWLCRALAPLAKHDCRRRAMIESVKTAVLARADSPRDPAELEQEFDEEIQVRIIRSGRTSVSRAVSDLVKAGLLRRHYQGYRVDHPNRGAQREAVYTMTNDAKMAFSRQSGVHLGCRLS